MFVLFSAHWICPPRVIGCWFVRLFRLFCFFCYRLLSTLHGLNFSKLYELTFVPYYHFSLKSFPYFYRCSGLETTSVSDGDINPIFIGKLAAATNFPRLTFLEHILQVHAFCQWPMRIAAFCCGYLVLPITGGHYHRRMTQYTGQQHLNRKTLLWPNW